MKLLKYVVPALVLNKLYKKRYSEKPAPTSEEERDKASDAKDDAL